MDLKFEDPKLGGYLTSGFVSKHIGADRPYNEDNSGIGYMTNGGWLGGVYRNSLDKTSVYLAKELATQGFKIGPADLKAALTVGLATGYGRPVTPVVMPGITASFGDSQLALGAVPPVKDVTPLTLALQLRKRF